MPRPAIRRQAMPKTIPSLPESANAFGAAVGDIWKSMAELSLPLPALSELQSNYVKQATDIWNGAVERMKADGEDAVPRLPDRRFAANEWAANPVAALTAQIY